MNINYAESFNFKPIPSITPASDYWHNGTWKFNMPEITVGTAPQPSWQDIILSGNTALTLTNALEDGLNYVKLFGACKQKSLPDGYTELEYIESSGTQWINTGISPSQMVIPYLEATFQMTSLADADYFGTESTHLNTIIWDIDGSSKKTYIRWATTTKLAVIYASGHSIDDLIFADGLHTLKLVHTPNASSPAQSDIYVDGVYIGYIASPNQMENPYPIKLFDARLYPPASCRFKRFILGNGDTILLDAVACRRNSDNAIGMYDKITNTFLPNAGTGTFIAGAEVSPSPNAPMDIVCNNGAVRVNRNLYSTEYHDKALSQIDGVTTSSNAGVNVSTMVDCRTIKSFKITTASLQGSFRIFKYGADNTFIDATSTANIGDIVTFGDNVGFFRIQYNYTSASVGTENILIYDSAYNLGIYTDGTIETVDVHGKNLFDKNSIISDRRFMNTVGSVYNSSSDATDMSGRYIGALIPVQEGEVYIKNNTADAFHRVKLYDGNKICLRYVDEANTITIQQNEAYMAISGYLTEINTTELNQILGTATAEMLLKLGNYKDTQNVTDGHVIRNIGIKVLNGTENWTLSGAGTAQDPKRFAVSELIAFPDSNTIECLSTHYPFSGVASTGAGITLGTFNIGIYNNIHYIRFAPTGIATVTDWTDYLKAQYNAGTPVIIVYPLATTTTETVTGQPLTTQAGTNIVEITQSAIDNLGLEVSFKQSTI